MNSDPNYSINFNIKDKQQQYQIVFLKSIRKNNNKIHQFINKNKKKTNNNKNSKSSTVSSFSYLDLETMFLLYLNLEKIRCAQVQYLNQNQLSKNFCI